MVYVFLAEGFEEIEALTPVDILKRAGVEVCTVGCGGKIVCGSHGIKITCDLTADEITENGLEMIILPGGQPGTDNLEKNAVVQSTIDYGYEKGIWIAAICAAPLILGHKGLLKGKKAVCYPGYESELREAKIEYTSVCEEGNFITAKGAGCAVEFALTLVSKLKGRQKADAIKACLQCI